MSKQLNLFNMNIIEKQQKQHTQEIDFGTGKITVIIEPGSSIDIMELVDALKEVALIVPLPTVIKNIRRAL